jgi:hypothetical protein
MDLQGIIRQIQETPNCKVYPSVGKPILRVGHKLPDDLDWFYQMYGGMEIHDGEIYGHRIVPPSEFVPINTIMFPGYPEGEWPEDRSDDWYTIAENYNGDYLAVDLNPERVGRCYNCFYEIHCMPGEQAVVALSFTDLVKNILYAPKNLTSFWDDAGFIQLGDAYDD